nr:hypothetical protein GCM10020093_070670 [Planobispora longispora]
MLRDYHASTNYSVVDLDLIDELYRRHYQEKVRGTERLRILNASRLTGVAADGTGLRATVEFLPTGERTELEADALVYATGYRPGDPLTLLGEAGAYCHRLPGAGCGSAATTGWPPPRRCAAASTSRAPPSTRTASPRRCCRPPPYGSARSSGRSPRGCTAPATPVGTTGAAGSTTRSGTDRIPAAEGAGEN